MTSCDCHWPGRSQQDGGGSLLVDNTWIATLPSSHHVDRRRAGAVGGGVCKAERVAAVRRAEVDRHHH